MNHIGDHMKMDFDKFQRQKLMLQTVRVQKVDENNNNNNNNDNNSNNNSNNNNNNNNKLTYLSSFHVSLQSYLQIVKIQCIFCNFVVASHGNISLIKEFIYMYLKVLITLFQKMIWFVGV